MTVRIRRYSDNDLGAIADIHAQAFTRQGNSKEWITCNARAYPRMRLYVAEFQGGVRGFILWTEKSGFRQDVVLELEQVAVAAAYRKRGIGKTLGAEIVQSLYSADEVLMVARNPLGARQR